MRYFRLSTGGMSERGSFSQMTGMRSGYFSRMRAASALRLSIGWSCLYANESDGMVYYSMAVSTRAWGITPVSARNKSFWMLDRDPERKLWGSVVKWC